MKNKLYIKKMMEALNNKERLVLEAVVRNFILSAMPVASNYIAKHTHLSFSGATIRSILAKLEEKGYVTQPHASSGRVPTTKGYRLYVDQMMKRGRLSRDEKEKIRKAIEYSSGDYDTILREATRILAHLSHQLGVIISPQLDEGTFHHMDIHRLSSERIMLILSIKSGMVKTIVLDLHSTIPLDQLESLKQILNERLHGLKLREIRSKFKEIVQDIHNDETGLMHVFIKSANRIFNFSDNNEVFVTGTSNILRQPEFVDNLSTSQVVELLENKNIVIHLLGVNPASDELIIRIGEEIQEDQMHNCSIITARYRIDKVPGTLGIIGPKRMDYGHLIPLVEFTANLISDAFQQN